MSGLDWRQTKWGYECPGYRVVADATSDGLWRLEHTDGAASPDGFVSEHRSFEDAVQWAELHERDRLRRLVASGHFLISAVALALFVFLSQFIGSLAGLVMVAGAFYVTLRSAGNGLGVILQEAWGWTRPQAGKRTILERLVLALARRVRSQQLAATRLPQSARVRELAPGPPP